MTALKILGIILLVILLIGFLRFGVIVSFGEELRVRLRVGPLKLTVCPRKKKKAKKKKAEKPQPEQEAAKKEKKPKKRSSFPKPTLDDVLDLIDTAFSALRAMVRRACRRVRIDPLDLTVVFGGWDPASVAAAFGAANTVMYTVMPRAEETFYIPDPSLHLRIDYDQERTTAAGAVGISLRVCDLFAIVFALLIPLAKWFLRFKRAHRHDKAVSKEGKKKTNDTNDTEERIA